MIGMFVLINDRSIDASAKKILMPLVLMTAASLGVGWLLRSVVANNNDLGWRAVLPAILLLIVFAATVISRWPAPGARIAGVMAALGVVLALPDTFQLIREDLFASPTPSERQFAASPPMWQAVRRYAATEERIANNPAFLGDATPWPVNISWALLGNRRSCYAGDGGHCFCSGVGRASRRDEGPLRSGLCGGTCLPTTSTKWPIAIAAMSSW